MRNILNRTPLLICFFIGLLSSCEREGIAPGENPARVAGAPEGFAINAFVVPSSPVNLQFGPAGISASLSHEVSWDLTLTGAMSKAEKTFTGLSSDVQVQWNGSHSGLCFFRAGEDVYAELSFVGTDVVARDTFRIATTKVHDGVLLFQNTGFDRDFIWPCFSFAETGETGAEHKRVSNNSVQGTGSFYLKGKDVNNTYFICAVRDQTSDPNVPNPSPVFFDFPTSDPDSVFFNVYVYGTGNPATMGGIGAGEDENMNGRYEDNKFHSEDTWDYQFRVDWTGWKLVSAPYSAFQRSANPSYGGTGNAEREPEKIRQITLNLLSSPPMNEAEIWYDFPIITFGKPFDPHK